MPDAASRDGAPKKATLTLAQLANYDDLITDILVDRTYFWTTIRKNRARYSACRGMKEEDIPNILRDTIIEEGNIHKACRQLIELPGIKRAYERLGSHDEREHFREHLRRYLAAYLPSCPWEVSTTNRYTIDNQEAAVFARQDIGRSEPVRFLVGIQVPITPEEEKNLDLTRRDFSIVKSSRKKTSFLFLGPARFANHDCDANARLSAGPGNGMSVIATKDIAVGDEITVTYGDQFFGPDNCECLCHTCEVKGRNGWNPDYARTNDESDDSDPGLVDGESNRGRSATRSAVDSRSHSQASNSHAGSSHRSTPQNSTTPSPTKRPRVEGSTSPTKKPSVFDRIGPVKLERTPSALSHEVRPDDIPDSNSKRIKSTQGKKDGQNSSPSTADGSQYSTDGTVWSERDRAAANGTVNDATRTNGDVRGKATNDTQAVLLEEASANLLAGRAADDFGDGRPAEPAQSSVQASPGQHERFSNLPELTIEYAASQVSVEGPTGSPERDYLNARKMNREGKNHETPHEQGRRPGDYSLTRRLLCQPGARWVECRNCDSLFVQQDAHQTRQSCPRCERHLKLYGYRWPKTQKLSKFDPEERIRDYREIHPFIFADEERTIRKGRSSHLRELLTEREQNSGASRAMSSDDVEYRPRRTGKRKIDYYRTQEEEWETDVEQPIRASSPKRRKGNNKSLASSSKRQKRAYVRSGLWTREAKEQRKRVREARQVRGERIPRVKAARGKITKQRLRPDGTPKRAYNRSGKYAGRAARRIESKAMQLANSTDGVNNDVKLPENAATASKIQARAEEIRNASTVQPQKRKYVKSGKYSKKNKDMQASRVRPGRKPKFPQVRVQAREQASVKPSAPSQPARNPQDGIIEEKGKRYKPTKWKGWAYVEDVEGEGETGANSSDDELSNLNVDGERRTRSGRIVSQTPMAIDSDDGDDDWTDEEDVPQRPRRGAQRAARDRRPRFTFSDAEHELAVDDENDAASESSDYESSPEPHQPPSMIVRLQGRTLGRLLARHNAESSGDTERHGDYEEEDHTPRSTQRRRNIQRLVDSESEDVDMRDVDESDEDSIPRISQSASKASRGGLRGGGKGSVRGRGKGRSSLGAARSTDILPSSENPTPKRPRGRPRKEASLANSTPGARDDASVPRRSKRARDLVDDEDDDGVLAKKLRSSTRKSVSEHLTPPVEPRSSKTKFKSTKWKGWYIEVEDNSDENQPVAAGSGDPQPNSTAMLLAPPSAVPTPTTERSLPQILADPNYLGQPKSETPTSSRASSTRRKATRPSLMEKRQSVSSNNSSQTSQAQKNYVTTPREIPLQTPTRATPRQSPQAENSSFREESEAPAGQRSPGKLRRPSKWRHSVGEEKLLKRPSFNNVITKTNSAGSRKSYTNPRGPLVVDDSE